MIQLPQIDLNSVLPVAGLAAIAIVVIIALLLYTILHSRLALLLAIVAGIVVAGPALGAVLTNIINTFAVVLIVGAACAVGVLLIIRSHPDLLDMSREALSLLPRKTSEPPTTLMIPPANTSSRAIIVDHPSPRQRTVSRQTTDGSDWGF